MLTPQFILPLATKLIVDLFAGGGGASTGIEQAIGRHVDIAINHDRKAVAMHQANHPQTRHFMRSVWDVDPRVATDGQAVGLIWASPDCRHFSPAKGSAPVSDRVRSLAWVVIRWAEHTAPDVICLENIPEFRNWGPVIAGRPCPDRKGKTFRRFVKQLERSGPGYDVEFRVLKACDYDVPTSRTRLFMVAKRKGLGPIVWPEPTNGPGLKPYRTAAECIDFSIPCPSIFERERPLVDATLRRIAHGVVRYVIESPAPFIVPITHQGAPRSYSLREPVRTVTASQRGEFALVTAFLAKHYGGHETPGTAVDGPISTITTQDHHHLVASSLVKLRGTSNSAAANEPLHTISAGGWHHAEVRALLVKFYGTATGAPLGESMPTVTTKDRLALVTVRGEQYAIGDIGMRMLQPRELFRAQGFADSYVIEWGIDPVDGKRIALTKTDQVRMCGNSVCPGMARAIVAANYTERQALRRAA